MPRCCGLLVASVIGLLVLLAVPPGGMTPASAQQGPGFGWFGGGFADDNWDGNRRARQRAQQQQPQQQQRRTMFSPFGFGPPQTYRQGGWFQNQNRGWRQNRGPGGTLWGSDSADAPRVRPRPRRFWWFENPPVREVVEEDTSGPDDGDGEAAQIYTYRPEPLVQVTDPKAGADHPPKLDDPMAQSLWQRLRDGTSGARATAAQRKAVLAFYEGRGFTPVWVTRNGVEPRVAALRHYFAAAAAEGLDPRDYLVAAEVGHLDKLSDSEKVRTLARFDIQLTVVALRYAQHASGGRIIPNRLSGYHDLNPPTVPAEAALAALAASPTPERYLASLHPTHPAYAIFRRALMQQGAGNEHAEESPPIAAGPTIREGQRDDRVPLLRKRLARLGFLTLPADETKDDSVEAAPLAGDDAAPSDDVADPGAVSTTGSADDEADPSNPSFGDSEGSTGTAVADQLPADPGDSVLSAADSEALRSFQEQSGLRPDGIVGNVTIARLNDAGEPKQVQRIIDSMERLRWMPRDLGTRHVLVNQAAFELQVVDHNRPIWQTRVIVGKPNTQTAVFSDVMETVEFNPYWGVPQSIIIKEMLPHLRRDPSYLDRMGYEVLDGRGREIGSSYVDWSRFSNKVPLSVRQPPGEGNALGVVKFLFPNSHAIYMHDTPTKSLFEKKVRAFSHGCVRVQNPRELAELVLGWDAERVDAAIEQGSNQAVRLSHKLPVHLAYFTAWPDETGRIIMYPDVYSRDAQLDKALGGDDVALR
ncbi:MAG TPA: L,D-transpeptidase family protein [Aestuariivirgaceae bacterium]|nr:L,D-transpeptidase family protein [Aestuariivirgaceae bacterium]